MCEVCVSRNLLRLSTAHRCCSSRSCLSFRSSSVTAVLYKQDMLRSSTPTCRAKLAFCSTSMDVRACRLLRVAPPHTSAFNLVFSAFSVSDSAFDASSRVVSCDRAGNVSHRKACRKGVAISLTSSTCDCVARFRASRPPYNSSVRSSSSPTPSLPAPPVASLFPSAFCCWVRGVGVLLTLGSSAVDTRAVSRDYTMQASKQRPTPQRAAINGKHTHPLPITQSARQAVTCECRKRSGPSRSDTRQRHEELREAEAQLPSAIPVVSSIFLCF